MTTEWVFVVAPWPADIVRLGKVPCWSFLEIQGLIVYRYVVLVLGGYSRYSKLAVQCNWTSLFEISDFDECSTAETHNCNADAVCNNTMGSYTCSCKTGYFGDGWTCKGKCPLFACVPGKPSEGWKAWKSKVFLLVTYKGFKCSNNISNRLLRCDPLLLKKNDEFLGTIKREGFNQSEFT